MGRYKRVAGLPLRRQPPTEEERLQEIIEVFLECNLLLSPEQITEQFYRETRKIPDKQAVLDLIKKVSE